VFAGQVQLFVGFGFAALMDTTWAEAEWTVITALNATMLQIIFRMNSPHGQPTCHEARDDDAKLHPA
jgi:hypothetical protein